jgi:hypothetical protein
MAVDLKKWKQRNAAARVKAALTRPKKDDTGERLRRKFASAADKAVKALNVKGRNPWLRYGYNDEVVVTAKLGSQIIPVTGDEAIALRHSEAEAYLKDVIDAISAGQLDRELLAAAGAAPAPKHRQSRPKAVASVGAARVVSIAARAPMEVGLKGER